MAANQNYTLEGSPISITPTSSGGGRVTTKTYTITVTQGVNGKISPDSVKVEKNESKTFTITADEGYEISNVLINGKSVGVVSKYTFEKVTANNTIKAKFTKIEEKPVAPNMNVTRAMFVTTLYRAEQHPSGSVSPFTDIESGAYYEKAVAWAAANGIVKGVSETEFAPNRSITREQMAAPSHIRGQVFYCYYSFCNL